MTAPGDGQPLPRFASPEEFGDLCAGLADALHAKNRIAMGESQFVWQVADALRRLGRCFETHYDDPAIRAAFGNGWATGSLPREERAAALFALIYPQKPA
jgi:hypothetical protein